MDFTAITATDVAGYSRLIRADEEGTIAVRQGNGANGLAPRCTACMRMRGLLWAARYLFSALAGEITQNRCLMRSMRTYPNSPSSLPARRRGITIKATSATP